MNTASNRGNEQAFFSVLSNSNIWKIMKKFMYVNKKKSNIYDYRNGDVAGFYGYTEIFKFNGQLPINRLSMGPKAAKWAVLNHHDDTVEWLCKNQEWCCSQAANAAAIKGRLEIIKMLHDNKIKGFSTSTMDIAAQNGHLDIIKWLSKNRTEGCTTLAMDSAAENGHISVIKWLNKNRTEGCTTFAIDMAARNGHINAIRWLNKNRTGGCTTMAMGFAACHGHLEIVKFLHNNRTEGCTKSALDHARRIQMYELEKSKIMDADKQQTCEVHIDEHNTNSPKEPANNSNKERANPRDVITLLATKPVATKSIAIKSIATKPVEIKPIAIKRTKRNVITS